MKKFIYCLTDILKESKFHENNKRIMRTLHQWGERRINRLDTEKYYWTAIYGWEREQFVPYLTHEKYRQNKSEILQMHYVIEQINEILLTGLNDEYRCVLKPYQGRNIIFEQDSDIQYKELEEKEISKKLLDCLNNNPVYTKVKSLQGMVIKRNKDKFIQIVYSLYQRLKRYGYETLKDYNAFSFSIEQSDFSQEVISLLHYKAMIENIDQILFQAFVSDVLLTIKQDDVIKRGVHQWDRKGEWINVITRVIAGECMNHNGEIVLYENEKGKMLLGEVLVHMQKKCYEEYIEEFKMRIIDDDFWDNPFFL